MIAAIHFLPSDVTLGTELGLYAQIALRRSFFAIARLGSGTLRKDLSAGDIRMPFGVTRNACTAPTVAANHETVVFGEAILPGFTVGNVTALEMSAFQASFERKVVISGNRVSIAHET